MPEAASPVVLLDAMGVLYKAGDDVAELLVPFIQARNPTAKTEEIERVYISASLGEIPAQQLWRHFGLDPMIEDEYLQGHELQAGAEEFLMWMQDQGIGASCLSNDVGDWSRKLRQRFGLESRVRHWVISGDVHLRKPDPAIYRAFLERSRLPAHRVVFVDDRKKNVDAAASLGFNAVLFGDHSSSEFTKNRVCSSFLQVRQYCEVLLARGGIADSADPRQVRTEHQHD